MIAIPVDTNNFGIKSSKLFGNAPSFALYDTDQREFTFKENTGCGNGIKTAETLHSWGVKSVVYSYLGNGPFNSMEKDGIDIYYIGKESIGIAEIVDGLKENTFTKVDTGNADTYLDPGTNSENCECGCDHD